jgi:hypothetical protein
MKCNRTKENDEQCEAHAMRESEYCYLHNPEITKKEKRDAQSRGGENKQLRIVVPLPPLEITRTSDVVSLLTDTIHRVRSGEMEVKIANCIGVLSGHLLHAFEISEMQNRAEEIERLIIERRRR